MNLVDAANAAHKQINRFLPQSEITYNGKTYCGYMNAHDMTLERQDGGYLNQRDRIIHIQTGDEFQLGEIVKYAGEKFKIAAIASNCVYKTLTLTVCLYD